MENLIRAICQKEGLPAHEIRTLSGGQVNQVRCGLFEPQ